jgi:hypothetical protein
VQYPEESSSSVVELATNIRRMSGELFKGARVASRETTQALTSVLCACLFASAGILLLEKRSLSFPAYGVLVAFFAVAGLAAGPLICRLFPDTTARSVKLLQEQLGCEIDRLSVEQRTLLDKLMELRRSPQTKDMRELLTQQFQSVTRSREEYEIQLSVLLTYEVVAPGKKTGTSARARAKS